MKKNQNQTTTYEFRRPLDPIGIHDENHYCFKHSYSDANKIIDNLIEHTKESSYSIHNGGFSTSDNIPYCGRQDVDFMTQGNLEDFINKIMNHKDTKFIKFQNEYEDYDIISLVNENDRANRSIKLAFYAPKEEILITLSYGYVFSAKVKKQDLVNYYDSLISRTRKFMYNDKDFAERIKFHQKLSDIIREM